MDDNEIKVTAEQELKFEAPLSVLDNPDHFPLVLTEDDIPGASSKKIATYDEGTRFEVLVMLS